MAILKEDKTSSGFVMYEVPDDDTNVLLPAGTTYYFRSTGGGQIAILDQQLYSSFVCGGTIYSTETAFVVSTSATGHFHLSVTGSGYVYGQSSAVRMASLADDMRFEITNAGTIASDSDGSSSAIMFASASSKGYLDLTNSGMINAPLAILGGGSADLIVNTGTINGKIDMAGGNDRIENSGTIHGDIDTGLGVGTVINSGTISGVIYLSGPSSIIVNTGTISGVIRGADASVEMDTHNGTLTGAMYGSTANDRYVIAGTETIVETLNGGAYDQVTSYGDYVLPAYVEALRLTGNATRGVGNAQDNSLIANPLGAILSGRGGVDHLFGGIGDDRLTGGAGKDVFVFSDEDARSPGGWGDDTIIDFTARQDKIDLSSVAKAVKFANLHIVNVKGDAIITVDGSSDTITLKGVAAASIKASDFVFHEAALMAQASPLAMDHSFSHHAMDPLLPMVYLV